jgi:cytochrome c oxidase assembly protein subunit 11
MDGPFTSTLSYLFHPTSGGLRVEQKYEHTQGKKNRKLITKLVICVPLMFAFAYLLVPIYNWACIQVGANGRLMTKAVVYDPKKITVDKTRTVRIRFLGDLKANVPWEFKPERSTMQVHPGDLVDGYFIAKNMGAEPLTARVVVNTIPAKAVKHVHEVMTCFCLHEQHLMPGEQTRMPVGFYVDDNLPKDIHEIMMSYTLFKSKQQHNHMLHAKQ